MNPVLTESETAYVRRFCWETTTSYENFGPGSIFDYCRDHCRDLEVLATVTNIQGEVLDNDVNGNPAPEQVLFPWASFEELHSRAEELTEAKLQ